MQGMEKKYNCRIGKISGKNVVITGCDSGFGQALALHLDALGFHVFAGCLTHNGYAYLTEKCSTNLTTILLDVTKTESIEKTLNVVRNKLPENQGVWALINNAGILGPMGCLEMCSLDDYHEVFNVNLYGTIEVTRKFLPLIRQSGGGRIVNMSCILGRFALTGSPYTFSKHGIESFSDILRQEVYKQNIRVSIIEPSGYRTNLVCYEHISGEMKKMYEKASEEVKATYSRDYLDKYKAKMLQVSRSSSPNLEPVLDAVVHAVTAQFPHRRYLIGSNELYFLALAYLPDWITDWIVKKTVWS
ncbi:Retinol dehydrogenase 7 [Bulinus truncatus]|nr:Retinol dehydrogenase 7 [Bulinus truncatus]